MATEPLTGAQIPTDADAPLGGTAITRAISDLADKTLPRFATSGERDTKYQNWVNAGHTMTAGLHAVVNGRLQRHTGSAWETVPGFRGAGDTFPADAVVGDTYYHNTLRCQMVNNPGGWGQDSIANVVSDSDRAAYASAVAAAGLTLHNGFLVFQSDTDQLWASVGGSTTLKLMGGQPAYATRPICQVQRTNMPIAANADADVWTQVNNWAAIKSTPDITVAASGVITMQKDGWVAVNGYAYSDDTVAGRAGVALDVPAAAFPVSRIVDVRSRAVSTSYGSAGVLRQLIAWSGRVRSGDTFTVWLNQDSTDNGSVNFNIHLAVEYRA